MISLAASISETANPYFSNTGGVMFIKVCLFVFAILLLLGFVGYHDWGGGLTVQALVCLIGAGIFGALYRIIQLLEK